MKNDDIIKANSIIYWMQKNGFVNEIGKLITFAQHLFLFDIYRDLSQKQVIKKAAQVGVSVCMILKVWWLARYKKLNIIYTLPSDSDVWEFVPTKVDKIYSSNPQLRAALTTNKTEMKELADRFIHFKGTRSKTAPIMTTADALVHDELDRSDQNIIDQYASRIGRSEFKGTWALSNPSLTMCGVDLQWKDSDQKEWTITCGKCKREQVLRWGDNVDEARRVYICSLCKEPLDDEDRRKGRWVAQASGAISGYHISQMMAPWLSCAELCREKETKGLEYFQNFVLGEPYHVGEVEDFRQLIMDCWTPKGVDDERYYMGVDIGREKHYVIGTKKGILKIGVLETREQLTSLIEKYNPIVVMDAGPERTWAEEFRRTYPKCFINFYNRDRTRSEIIRWGEEENWGIVYSDRNRLIDTVVHALVMGEILFAVEKDILLRFIKHWENMRRVKVENALGVMEYRWERVTESAPDHWSHALCYYWIARHRMGEETTLIREEQPKKEIIVPTADGFRMVGIKEMMDIQRQYDE